MSIKVFLGPAKNLCTLQNTIIVYIKDPNSNVWDNCGAVIIVTKNIQIDKYMYRFLLLLMAVQNGAVRHKAKD